MLNGTGKILVYFFRYFVLFADLDASLFPPNLHKDEVVYSYNADMCR